MKQRINNNSVDERLIQNNIQIKRLGNCLKSKSITNWQCLVCNHIWFARVSHILCDSGCPNCAGNIPLSNDIVDKRLLDNAILIKRIGKYVSINAPIEWKCLNINCNYIWNTTTGSVLNGKNGCPKCAGNFPLTNEIIDKRLVENNKQIKRIGDCINAISYIEWLCLICKYIWSISPHNVLNGNSGCPRCAKVIPLTNDIIDERLIIDKRSINRLGNCSNAKAKIDWQCLKCNHIWITAPNNILNSGSSCPKCNKPGMNETIIISLLDNNNIKYEYDHNIHKIDVSEKQRYRLDFYFQQYSIAIEYNGKQHYGPFAFKKGSDLSKEEVFKIQQTRDKYVSDFCGSHNINLIWIDGRKYKGKSLVKYMTEEIIPLLTRRSKINVL